MNLTMMSNVASLPEDVQTVVCVALDRLAVLVAEASPEEVVSLWRSVNEISEQIERLKLEIWRKAVGEYVRKRAGH